MASAWFFVEPWKNMRIAPAALPGGAAGLVVSGRW
jgi:hypothetical protein